MASLKNAMQNKVVELIVNAVEEEVDGRELTDKLDKAMDFRFGEGTSERIQRGPIARLLVEMLEGLFAENPEELIERAKLWIKEKENAIPPKNPRSPLI